MNELLIRACCPGIGLFHAIRLKTAAFASRIRNQAILKSWPIRLLAWFMVQLLLLVGSLCMGFVYIVIGEYLGSDGAILARLVP